MALSGYLLGITSNYSNLNAFDIRKFYSLFMEGSYDYQQQHFGFEC